MTLIPIKAENNEAKRISRKLQFALNNKNEKNLKTIFSKEQFKLIKNERNTFLNYFPNANWVVKPIIDDDDEQIILEINVTGDRELEKQQFSLKAKQNLAIKLSNGQLINYEILNESSVLKTTNTPLKIEISIPDKVLTNSNYNIDIILNEPLGDNLLSGGISVLDNKEINMKDIDYVKIFPLSSGGIFKSIQAPPNPGKQTLTALIVHPKGIISIKKIVQIVKENNQLSSYK